MKKKKHENHNKNLNRGLKGKRGQEIVNYISAQVGYKQKIRGEK